MSSVNHSKNLAKDRLLKQVNGDEDLLHELISIFLSTTNTALLNLRQDIEANDFKKLRKTVHRLKGSMSMFSLDSEVQSFARIEKWAQQQSREKLLKEWHTLEKEVYELQQSLRNILSHLQAEK